MFNKTGFIILFWSIISIILLHTVHVNARNIPIFEDWYAVSPFTGHENDTLSWLWEQNSEHRTPLPRFILLLVLEITNGNFIFAYYINLAILVSITIMMILLSRYLRGGKNILPDLFFPLALLHLGHASNIFMSWQLGFTITTFLFCILIVLSYLSYTLNKLWISIIAGICIIFLPLCGANGLLLVPLTAIWFYISAATNLKYNNRGKTNSIILIVSSSLSLVISALYFVGYKSPSWVNEPRYLDFVINSLKVFSFGLGPAAKYSWSIATIITLILFSLTIFSFIRLTRNKHIIFQLKYITTLFFISDIIITSFVIGWGRTTSSELVNWGLPARYVIFVMPLFLIFYLFHIKNEMSTLGKILQYSIFLIYLVVFPLNYLEGKKHINSYNSWTHGIAEDINNGASVINIQNKYKDILIPWWDDKKFYDNLEMLKDKKVKPFINMK